MRKILLDEYPGYAAGADGHIYSYKSSCPRRLVGRPNGLGKYLFVSLRVRGQTIERSVHSLVCRAFHGERPTGHTVSHENGDDKDNRPWNLRWRTHSDNCRKKIEHQTDDSGTRNSRALFDEKQILKIRKWLSDGVTSRDISRRMGCDERVIGKIKRGERYVR